MCMKRFLLTRSSATAIAFASMAAAQQVKSPLGRGTESDNVANQGQISPPNSNPAAQAQTERELIQEQHRLSGDYRSYRPDAGQIQEPQPNPQAQAQTSRELRGESAGLSGDYSNYNRADRAQIQPPVPNLQEQRRTTRTLRQQNQATGAINGRYE
jgi:hypothetical protein